jgi:uncharacterized GH25 family protein
MPTMNIQRRLVSLLVPLLVASALPLAAQAKSWLLPSQTVLPGPAWVTIDAATSDQYFYFNRGPLGLETLSISAPDGTRVEPQNSSAGKLRNSFDLQLTQTGTYRITTTSDSINGSYEENGARKRFRGTLEEFRQQVPAGAAKLEVRQNQQRVETFVTARKPSNGAMKSAGVGLELLPVTHPNDLYAGETAKFRFTLDGKPAAGVEVSIIPGGTLYRDQPNEVTLKADAAGEISFTWPQAGMYLLEASVKDAPPSIPQAQQRNALYTATLEVLPQ